MEPLVNRRLFELVTFDSATPGGHATVVHRFRTEGQYVLSVVREDREVESRSLTLLPGVQAAGADAAAAPRAGSHPPESVTIDLRDSQTGPGVPRPAARPPSRITLPAGGYAAFTAPPGVANRAVVRRVGTAGEQQDVEFDTAELGPEDVFALTLLRPGTYAVRNAVSNQTGRIVVTYPVVGDVPYRPADAVDVRVEGAGFDPADVTVGPGQGVVFRVGTRSRITIDLTEPDDGPGDAERPRRPLARWRAGSRPDGDREGDDVAEGSP